jgi:hypothetical protein
MNKIFTTLLLALCAQVATATSIVIVVTPKYILIGADSKRIFLDNDGNVNSEKTVCKIRSAGTYCFAMAGFTTASGTSFAADSIVSRHLKMTSNYKAAISNIKTDIRNALVKELRFQRLHQPAAFRQLATVKDPLLEVVILSMHNGAPRMEIIGFQLTYNNDVQVASYATLCPGDCPGQQQQVYFLGSYQIMEQQLAAQRYVNDPSVMVENLIRNQSKATPSSVGEPVRIARYSAIGMEWVK